jgi:hypothetical protein
MTTADKPHLRPEALETFRYRRRLLQNRRTHLMDLIATDIRESGKPQGRTSRRLRNCEADIRAYNAIAEEYGLQPIR